MLQLAVKAGSVDETDAQQGLAHFLEHMGFNGTTHFKPGELIATFESTGARLGPHVNAQTGCDDTLYMFQLPSDKPGSVLPGQEVASPAAPDRPKAQRLASPKRPPAGDANTEATA